MVVVLGVAVVVVVVKGGEVFIMGHMWVRGGEGGGCRGDGGGHGFLGLQWGGGMVDGGGVFIMGHVGSWW